MAVDIRPASTPARILEPIERQGWLDRLGDGVMSVLEPLIGDPRGAAIKDILHGRWLGHALHPVLSDLPIGLWTASVVADAAGEDSAAGLLTAAGSAAALATAASGVADWTVTDGRERRLALAHGLINTGGLALQLASLGARVAGRARQARTFSFAGWTISLVAAYLGGELVFDRGLMVNHDAWTAGPQQWTVVLGDNDLPERGHRKVEVAGRAILLSRADGRISALENACTHAGGPLDEGEFKDGMVTCPWHGSQFRLSDGAACRGPATYPQLRLEARVRAGMIEVRGR